MVHQEHQVKQVFQAHQGKQVQVELVAQQELVVQVKAELQA
jgi:hypothetical protein